MSFDVVILAAGLGLRLGPSTHDRPKALVPVAGRPLIDYALPFARSLAPRSIVDRLLALVARPGIVVLRNESLVFPWLERADAYVGDMSSLAYDYLAYDRPMVFLNRAAGSAADASGSRLFDCGAVLGPERYAEAYATLEAMRADDRARHGARRAALDRDLHPPDVAAADVRAGLDRTCAGPAPGWMRH